MKSNIFVKSLTVLFLVYMSSACSHQQVSLQTVYSSSNCEIKQETLKSITEQGELKKLLQATPKNFGDAPLSLPALDYEKQSVILYALGQKSTGGYGIGLYKPNAELKEGVLYLPIRTLQPASDSAQIQIITSPCQVYSLPYTEYSEIVIDDES